MALSEQPCYVLTYTFLPNCHKAELQGCDVVLSQFRPVTSHNTDFPNTSHTEVKLVFYRLFLTLNIKNR